MRPPQSRANGECTRRAYARGHGRLHRPSANVAESDLRGWDRGAERQRCGRDKLDHRVTGFDVTRNRGRQDYITTMVAFEVTARLGGVPFLYLHAVRFICVVREHLCSKGAIGHVTDSRMIRSKRVGYARYDTETADQNEFDRVLELSHALTVWPV